ncbi:unnamed protein product [Ilex paraguariensis]|uniref:2-oxoglutarate dehydrogenase E1 component/KDG C-terminal domain-containing protein n=1 Tax=Ilex paraguariensis TaxID=185542 RepID=A0ABC8R7C5_9AQUA
MDLTLRTQIQECNWLVVNVTTPANYFPVLRRQIQRKFRKPLIVVSPKNLLRHKDCKSNLSEYDDVQGHPGFDKQGTGFKRLIKDQNDRSDLEEGIRRLVLCSGKRELKRYPNAEVVWCQEEPMNMGAYNYIAPRLSTAMKPWAEVAWMTSNTQAVLHLLQQPLVSIRFMGKSRVNLFRKLFSLNQLIKPN